MRIYPAIDILEGGCVRLFRGDFEQRVTYHRDALEIALGYEAEGARYLHLVDLDGARKGELVNIGVLENLARQTRLSIDYGGGVNSATDIERLLAAGAQQVTVGSIAVREPQTFKAWLGTFGDKIILSADVNEGQVVIAGWTEATSVGLSELIERNLNFGLKTVACTDVSKDGTMTGPNFELYRGLVKEFPTVEIIASGGVANLEHVLQLRETGVAGVIIGKALLEGKLKLKDALV